MPALRIESLRLEGVRAFAAPVEARFAPEGVTVVHGPNESGKSTLLEGVGAVLFGTSARDLGDWQTDPPRATCTGTLRFRVDDAAYTVTRDFTTHYTTVLGDGDAHVYEGDANPDGRREPARRYRAWLTELLGFADAATFNQSARLALDGAPDDLTYEATVRELVSGAGAEDYYRVHGRLLEDFDALTQENPWGATKRKARAIETAREELDSLRGTLAAAEGAAQALHRAHEQQAEAREAVAAAEARERECEADQAHLSEVLAALKDGREAEEKARRAGEAVGDAQRIDTELQTLRDRLSREFADVAAVADDDLAAAERAHRLEREAVAAAQAAAAGGHAEPPPGSALPVVWAAIAAVAAAGAAVVGRGWVALLIVLVALVPALAVIALARRGRAQALADAAAHAAERERLEAHAADLRRQADAARAACPPAVLDRELDAVRTRLTERRLLEQEIRVREEGRRTGGEPETLQRRMDDCALELATARARVKQLHAEGADVHEITMRHAETARGAERARTDARAARDRLNEAERALGKASAAEHEPLAQLRERIADAEERLQALEQRRDGLRLAIDTLRDAAAEFQRRHTGAIGANASALLCGFAGAGWHVELHEESFEPALTWQGHPWEAVRLSAGTRDQFAVALRLAVVRALHGRVDLPLLLDDPLAHWDAARRAAFRATLAELAGAHQVILATPDPSLAGWGAAAVALGD